VSQIPDSILQRYGDTIEQELIRWLRSQPVIAHHYDLLAYHMGWANERLEWQPGPRGKRFRPLMALLSCEAAGGDWHDALSLSAAVEYLHNFSLIHDDIEDRDESRHHRPTVWKVVGDALAINAGDAMLALAGLAALSTPVPKITAERFQQTALALTEGQHLDMSYETATMITVSDYLKMIERKTAALISCSCELGARVGGGCDDSVAALQQFGHNFGIAFQIYDDLRGMWSTTRETGKVEAKDIANRKKSLPALLALEHSDGDDRELLEAYYWEHEPRDVSEILAAIDRTDAARATRDELTRFRSLAFEQLDSPSLRPQPAAELRALGAALIGSY
jgi:geranylgeranyl diphosphate synthase type I